MWVGGELGQMAPALEVQVVGPIQVVPWGQGEPVSEYGGVLGHQPDGGAGRWV